MRRSIWRTTGILAVLLAGATVQAELKLVANFDGLSGVPDGQACNGVLGGTIDTESENTGNAGLGTIDGSTALNVIGHSSGTMARAIGFNRITNTIGPDETGVGFFRFMVADAGHPIRPHMGLIADETTNPIVATNTQDPKTVPAGFRLVGEGTGFNVVTTDGETVLKTGLVRGQWYNVWIVADNSADTFDLYISEADGPAGAATLPKGADLVKEAIPFGVATAGPLTGMIFANPTGTGQAERIYVDEIWWDGDQGLSKPTMAKKPVPADKAQDVRRDIVLSWTPPAGGYAHTVYFGATQADVSSATLENPLGVLAVENQDANSFDPTLPLEFGRTYFWRIDEVNSAGDHAVSKGGVWSFTVEPVSYPIQDVTATASSFTANMDPQTTVDGSGLNADDQHSTDSKQMWLSNSGGPQPTWIQYEFDEVYKLDRMLVWNLNQLLESVLGFGAKDVTIDYSADGAAWTTLGEFEFARAPGKDTYVADTTVDFNGALARYVRLTIHSNWGGVLSQYGLSEVRFFYLPVLPREPFPAVGQTNVEVDAVLSWRAGREAASHRVLLGEDRQAVADGTAPVETVADSRLEPDSLRLGTAYYWSVAEVNDAEVPALWQGDVWSFTTREYLVIDDFESYEDVIDQDKAIFDAWLDGYVDHSSGSVVGHLDAPFAERTIVHGGEQSMPLAYDNTKSPYFSEATRSFSPAQDWTLYGADTLSLWTRGNPLAYVDNGGTVTMSGGGHDIWDTADDFRFAGKTLAGNGSAVVKVQSLTNTNAWAKAGVMIRQSLDADSPFVYMVLSYSNGVSLGWRPLASATCSSVNQAGIPAPQWVKLTRTGDVFTAQYSADGKTWTDVKTADGAVASATVAMAGPVYVGLCVTSHNSAAATTAVMSDVALAGAVGGDWQVTAIGDDPQLANDPADLYVTIQDGSGKAATAVNPTAATSGDWTQWKVPFSSLKGVNLKSVKKMVLGLGDRTGSVPGGAGMLYIDDIAFGRPLSQ